MFNVFLLLLQSITNMSVLNYDLTIYIGRL